MKTRMLIAMALVAVSHMSWARTFELAAWRGETVTAWLPDNVTLGAAPEGIGVREGALQLVKYAPEPDVLTRLETYDRVVWGGEGVGPRVVEVTVPADAKPGVYACGMMSVRVVDRVLPPPKEWKYYLDLWQHPWAVARMAGVKPFSKEHYAAMRPVWELLASAGQKTITVTILEQPWDHQCFDAYHSMVDDPDFRTFDEYVSFCLDCGLGPDISCYSLCPWTLGKAIDADELEKRWGAFLDRFAAHLRAKGWYGKTLMAMDERAPEDVRKVVEFVRRHAPGMRISMAGDRKPSDFDGIDIDVYAQILHHVTPDFVAEVPARRAKGFVTTHYVCCAPAHPNTFMGSPYGEAFWCGAFPAFGGLDGFLRWAWNSWPKDPTVDVSFCIGWPAGDAFLCYPNAEPSFRFLELRNGIVAAEKVRLLREQGLFTAEIDALAKKFVVPEAVAGKTRWRALREEVVNLVNK